MSSHRQDSHRQAFINHLQRLADGNRGAIAALRHSSAFELGADPTVFPLVEPWTNKSGAADDPYRLALYAVAALFAMHPQQQPVSFASAFGALRRARDSPSIEQRFIALLDADASRIFPRLRQAVGLLAADGQGLDYVQLLADLARWFAPAEDEGRWRALRQIWGRDFYRASIADRGATTPEAFIEHLVKRANADDWSQASAHLRRSLTQPPGEDPHVFALVEPWIDPDWKYYDARRRARYLVAGLFAMHPQHEEKQSLASALNQLARQYDADREGIERRFIALLGASSDTIADHLRQAMARLAGTSIGYDARWLLRDLSVWMPRRPNIEKLDQRRKRWARHFYWLPRQDQSTSRSKPTEGV